MVLQLLLAQFVHLSWGLFSCIINRFSPSNFFHFYRIFFQRIFRDKKVFFIFLELLKKISSRCDFPITSRPHFYFPHKDYSAVSVLQIDSHPQIVTKGVFLVLFSRYRSKIFIACQNILQNNWPLDSAMGSRRHQKSKCYLDGRNSWILKTQIWGYLMWRLLNSSKILPQNILYYISNKYLYQCCQKKS